MARRTSSAFQSLARAAKAAAFTIPPCHCRPMVLMPRSWTGLPLLSHRCVPMTCSRPYLVGIGFGERLSDEGRPDIAPHPSATRQQGIIVEENLNMTAIV